MLQHLPPAEKAGAIHAYVIALHWAITTLGVAASLPYDAWLAQVQAAAPDAAANPCVKIVPFLEDEFVRMATGQVVLDTADGLTEAHALYRSSGYIDVPRYNDNKRAALWMAKDL